MLRVLRRLNEEGPCAIVPTLLAAHTVPPEFAGRREEYVRWIAEELIPEVAAEKAGRYCDAFLRRSRLHRRRNAHRAHRRAPRPGLRIHAEQFRPGTGAALAAELGAAPPTILRLSPKRRCASLRAAGVQPVLLPGSVFALGRTQLSTRRAPWSSWAWHRAGQRLQPRLVAVPSMPFMLSLACLQMGFRPPKRSPRDHQCRVEPWPGRTGSALWSRQTGRFLIHEFTDYRELAYLLPLQRGRASLSPEAQHPRFQPGCAADSGSNCFSCHGPTRRCARRGCGSTLKSRPSGSARAIPTPSFPAIPSRASSSSASNRKTRTT
jgi:imidazolonepropionase